MIYVEKTNDRQQGSDAGENLEMPQMAEIILSLRAICIAVSAAIFPVGALAEARPTHCAMSTEEIFDMVSDSVVQINSVSINPFLVANRIEPRSGTGFVIEGGYILTNYHVIADSDVVFILKDDLAFEAVVTGIDPALDVALVKRIDELPIGAAVDFAEPGQLRIGQSAYALGYPLGIGKSISAGIVSGTSRVLPRTTSSWLSPLIQTDAAISPGNSGGPLVDECGRVIGLITSAIFDFGAENIGFAIPVEVLEPTIAALKKDGYVSRAWHGIYGQMATPPILSILGYPEESWEEATGFLVETVEPGSAGDVGGLRGGTLPIMWGMSEILLGGDIITSVNGERVRDMETAIRIVQSIAIGDRVELEFLRDEEPFSISIVVGERPILERELELYRRSP